MKRRDVRAVAAAATTSIAVALVLTLSLTAATNGCTPPTTTETTMVTTPPMRPISDPLYGVTLEEMSGATAAQLSPIVTSLNQLARPHGAAPAPTSGAITRVVFDEGEPPNAYTTTIDTLKPVTYIMGEILDSESMQLAPYNNADYGTGHNGPNGDGTQAYIQRMRDYLAMHGEKVDLWEVGNEIKGLWAGPYADQVAKILGAFNAVKAAKKKSALTLWYSPNCEEDGEADVFPFVDNWIQPNAPAMLTGLDYVFLSYYEVPCNNLRVPVATLKTVFNGLHARFPNAKIGFGEIGLELPAKAGTVLKAKSIVEYYYELSSLLKAGSNPVGDWYIGGLFYWYFKQDAVPYTKAIVPSTGGAGIKIHDVIKQAMTHY